MEKIGTIHTRQKPDNRRGPKQGPREFHPIKFTAPVRGIVWAAGLALILLGGVTMFQNMGAFSNPGRSWWSFVLLVPALLNLKWIVFGPVLIMLSGLGMLVNTTLPERG